MSLLPGKYLLEAATFILTRKTVALYGLGVPCGGEPMPALPDFPATVSVLISKFLLSKMLLGQKLSIHSLLRLK
jgi:hypothetical protein